MTTSIHLTRRSVCFRKCRVVKLFQRLFFWWVILRRPGYMGKGLCSKVPKVTSQWPKEVSWLLNERLDLFRQLLNQENTTSKVCFSILSAYFSSLAIYFGRGEGMQAKMITINSYYSTTMNTIDNLVGAHFESLSQLWWSICVIQMTFWRNQNHREHECWTKVDEEWHRTGGLPPTTSVSLSNLSVSSISDQSWPS